MALQLILSNKAQSQLINILEFYTERNKSTQYSKKLLKGFKGAFNLLKLRPHIGKRTSQQDTCVFMWGAILYFL